jgi:hypothetical protein
LQDGNDLVCHSFNDGFLSKWLKIIFTTTVYFVIFLLSINPSSSRDGTPISLLYSVTQVKTRKLLQGCCQADIRMLFSLYLFPVVVTNLEQSCYHLVTRLMTATDLLQVVPTRLIQAIRDKLLQGCCHQLVNNLLHADDIRLVRIICCESVGLVNLVTRWLQFVPDLSTTGNKQCEHILLTSCEIFTGVLDSYISSKLPSFLLLAIRLLLVSFYYCMGETGVHTQKSHIL